MDYHILNEKSTIDYVKNTAALGKRFSSLDKLTCSEVGDGNLNLVFILQNQEKKDEALVIKQAIPYLRCAGESWPLSRIRMQFESQALIWQHKLCPEFVPEVFHYDKTMSLVAMRYLGEHIILRKALIKKRQLPLFNEHISSFLATSLFCTSDLFLSGEEKKQHVSRFLNQDLCALTEDFVFTNPYMESEENKWNDVITPSVEALKKNAELKREIATLKEQFMTHTQALIHGDLHTGSIMVSDKETLVIDPEFAFYGPMGFDVGAIIGNFILSACAHTALGTESSYIDFLLNSVVEIWQGFVTKFEALWQQQNRGDLCPPSYWQQCGGEGAFASYRQSYLTRLLQDTAGFAGCKIMRRILGIAHVEDIESISDPKVRAVAELLALRIGSKLVLERANINGIDEVVAIANANLSARESIRSDQPTPHLASSL